MTCWRTLMLSLVLVGGVHTGEVMVAMASGANGAAYGEGYLYPPGWTVGPVRHLAEGTPYGAILADGSLLCWAYNMGLGTAIPTPVINDGEQMLMGTQFAVVRRGDGSLIGWGNAIYAGGTGGILPVPTLPGQAIDIAMGSSWAAALLSDGSVFTWGQSPPTVPVDARFTAIEANGSCLVGLRADGAVRAHGSGGATLGMPVAVSADGAGVQMISAGYNYTAALMPDGRILAWGPGSLSKNWTGPFDLLSMGGEVVLARRSTDSTVVCLDIYSSPDRTITGATGATQLRATSRFASHCRLADGLLLLNETPPVDGPPVGLNSLASVTTGGATCIGLQSDGRVVAWGEFRGRWTDIAFNNVAQARAGQSGHVYLLLTDSTLQRGNLGTFSQLLTGVRQFDTWSDYLMAVKNDGTVVWAGYGGSQVKSIPAGLSGVIAVSVGDDWAIALKADGTVVPWGAGPGQTLPPADLGDIIQLDCGYDHVLALRRDGTVRSWGGANAYGQRNVPAGLTGVVQVAVDGITSYALKSDGTVVQWGQQACTPASLAAITHAGQIHGNGVLLANRNVRPAFLSPPRTTAAGQVLLDVSWNWPVTGFATNDVTVSNGTVNAVSGSGSSWQLDVSPSGPGAVTVSIAAAAVGSEPGWTSLPANATFTALALSASDAAASTAEATAAVIALPNPNPVEVTYQIVATPTNGSVSAFSGNQITYTPVANYTGTDTFTYRVTNGAYWSAAATVTVTVRTVNRAPTLAALSNLAVLEDAAQQTVALSGIGPGRASESSQVLTVTATSSNPSVVPDPTVSYTNGQTTGSLAVAPVANAVGSAVITVRVQDDGGTADGGVNAVIRTFTVTVGPVNDPPTLAFIAGRSVAEDAPQQTITLSGISVGPANEAGQVLAPVAFSTAPTVVGHPTIDYTAGSTTATLRWQPVLDANGQARIFVTFSDDGGIADGGADSVSQSFLIDVTPVNDAPVLVRHDAVSLVVSTTRAIGSDVLQTTDVDAPPAAGLVYTLTVAPTRGQLLRNSVVVAVNGTFTQADIDANLLTFQAGAVVGADSFSFTVSDGIAAALPAAAVAITIQPSGGGGATPPLVTLDTGVITYVEGAGALLISPSATVNDVDSVDFSAGSLLVDLTQNDTPADRLTIQTGGRVALAGTTVLVDGANVGTWSGGVGAAALQIACTASATPDRIQALLRAIAFSNVSNAPSALERRVQVVVSDGDGGSSVPASRQIAVQPVNSPPDILLPTAAVAFTEGGGAIAIDPAAQASDADSTVIDGGNLQVAIATGGDSADRLQLADAGQVTVSGSTVSYGGTVVGTWTVGDRTTPLRVDFAGAAATPDAAKDVLRAVRFANASTAPSAAPRTLRATLSDGQDTSAPATVVVAVARVNDPPVVTMPDAPTFTEAAGAVRLSPNATIVDPDSDDFEGGGITVRLSAGANANDLLLVVDEGDAAGQVGVSGSQLRYGGVAIGTAVGGSDFAPLVVSFSSTAVTPAVARAVLRRVGFDNSSSNPLAGVRTVAVRVADGDGGQSAEVAQTLQVTDINAAPTLTASGTVSWTEDTAAVAVAAGAVVTDGDSADFAGGSLSAVITANVAAGDRLRIRHVGSASGQVGVDAGRILVGGVEVGTWAGGDDGAALVISFASTAATPAAAQAVAQQIVFASTSQAPSSAQRSIALVVNDGDGDASLAATVAVDVIPQNDPPQLAAQTLAVAAGAPASAVLSGSDPEGDACILELVTAPDAASGTMTILDAAARRVRFVPAAGFVGTTEFTVCLRETAPGGLVSTDRIISVRVTGASEPRPQAASEPPREAFRSQEWRWPLRVDTTGLADALPLELVLEGAPAGMQLVGREAVWQVPADQTLGVVRFGIRFVTPSGVAGWQEALILVRPAPGGGG
jgi:alpha-tubulin suppressor-like RCC1 family protein